MSGLPSTEAVDPATAQIDRLDDVALARTLAEAHRGAVDAAVAQAYAIARATTLVVEAIECGGRVAVFGAGTSGRLAVLDASELPPTFGLDPQVVEGIIAGGDAALRRAVENAEDDADAGARAADALVAHDVAIGISASGGAAFVRAALQRARERGARTIAVANAPGSPLAALADVAIVADTGAEPIAGSTRMRAGTAQKIVLNTISTGAMIRLGKTYRNRMVDVVATNAKLRARAERLVRELAGDVDASALLAAAGGSVKTAVVMARRGVDAAGAERLLRDARGRLARVIDPA
ncbi:N-acetylmuramic acid 6-phosphate etherase [Vulcanimicrobium alpinum]|uniref:N-acetylmuramic acid 6-phosphate etherase n=1 Tax=Vulcanimicrobium alpinum TaxID=3016050 RepID=A0AAN1XVC0_UNVUL|nr:N-acetylmuramic acid 6-phosphate etherase [Vulcanimicrobium alpinum]BDE06064.1 N-acetylmuramic acid 6-phosphate etherase [Vulcanimicrobium alpinum]